MNRTEGCDSIRSGNRQVLGCSGRGNEVLGFINFWIFLMVEDLLVLKKDLLQGVKLHLIGSTKYEVYHFGRKKDRVVFGSFEK